MFKLHGVMTGSVGSKGKHIKYVSGGGGGAAKLCFVPGRQKLFLRPWLQQSVFI